MINAAFHVAYHRTITDTRQNCTWFDLAKGQNRTVLDERLCHVDGNGEVEILTYFNYRKRNSNDQTTHIEEGTAAVPLRNECCNLKQFLHFCFQIVIEANRTDDSIGHRIFKHP